MSVYHPDSALGRTVSVLNALHALPDPVPPSNYKHPPHPPYIENYIDASAILGEASTVWWYSRILQHVRIGARVSIGGGTEIGRGSVIGDDSRIGANVFFPPNSVIGQRVFIGPNVVCTDDRHPKVPQPGDAPYDAKPPVIEDDASIGAGAILLPGVRIGTGARVAAGAIVTKDVAPRTMVLGGPAREREMPGEWVLPPTSEMDPVVENAFAPIGLLSPNQFEGGARPMETPQHGGVS